MINTYYKPKNVKQLAIILNSNLKDNIDIKKITETSEIICTYLTEKHVNSNGSKVDNALPVVIKCVDGEFAEIEISDKILYHTTLEEKLAAMSDIYSVMKELYSEPLAFYTLKNDRNNKLHLFWALDHKENYLKSFSYDLKHNTGSCDEIILINEQQFYSKEKLPKELIELIRDVTEYNKNKFGTSNVNGPSYVKKPKKRS